MRKFYVALLLLLGLGIPYSKADKKPSDWRAWRQNTTKVTKGSLSYYVHTPPKYNEQAGKTYPLLVILHWSYVNGSAYLHYWRPEADMADVIVAAPNSRGGAAWVRSDGPRIVKMVRELSETYPIDTDRIWLAGYSAGGLYAYRMLFEYPDVFDSVLALGGRVTPNAAKAAKRTHNKSPRVCLFHGAWDQRFGRGSDTRDAALLRTLGYDVKHVVVPRLGHWIPRNQGKAMVDCLAGGPWQHRLAHKSEMDTRRPRLSITPRSEYLLPASAAQLDLPNIE